MRVAGFGFRACATTASLRSALGECAGLAALATPEDKAESAVLQALAVEMGLPIRAIALAQLARQPTQTLSPAQPPRYGTGSVAEASALAACGPKARLVTARRVSDDGMATAAIAEGDG
ncbi:MAG: cobalamin biosynthesis protein [Paracoccaceae bacterium]|nr:cobalamin biosynthesis protein [Paracoccaceae bacterium]